MSSDTDNEHSALLVTIKSLESPYNYKLPEHAYLYTSKVQCDRIESEIKEEEQLESEEPFNWRCYVLNLVLSMVQYKADMLDEALKYLNESEKTFPSEDTAEDSFFQSIKRALLHIVLSSKARLYFDSKDYAKAQEMINTITPREDMNDNEQAAFYGVKNAIYYEINAATKTLDDIQEAVRLNPEEAQWNFLLGKSLRQHRRQEDFFNVPTELEIKCLEKACNLKPCTGFFMFLGVSLRELALKLFQKYSKDPQLGEMKFLINQLNEKAHRYLKKALENPTRLTVLGMSTIGKGLMNLPYPYKDPEAAKEILIAAVNKNPLNAAALQALGLYFHRHERDLDKALEFLELALKAGCFTSVFDIWRINSELNPKYDPRPLLKDIKGRANYAYDDFTEIEIEEGIYLICIERDLDSGLELLMDMMENNPTNKILTELKPCCLYVQSPISVYELLYHELKSNKQNPCDEITKVMNRVKALSKIKQYAPQLFELEVNENFVDDLVRSSIDRRNEYVNSNRDKYRRPQFKRNEFGNERDNNNSQRTSWRRPNRFRDTDDSSHHRYHSPDRSQNRYSNKNENQDRYQPNNRNRYPYQGESQDRYQSNNRNRYPNKGESQDRYHLNNRNRYPNKDESEDRYQSNNRNRYSHKDESEDRYQLKNRNRYPNKDENEDRYQSNDWKFNRQPTESCKKRSENNHVYSKSYENSQDSRKVESTKEKDEYSRKPEPNEQKDCPSSQQKNDFSNGQKHGPSSQQKNGFSNGQKQGTSFNDRKQDLSNSGEKKNPNDQKQNLSNSQKKSFSNNQKQGPSNVQKLSNNQKKSISNDQNFSSKNNNKVQYNRRNKSQNREKENANNIVTKQFEIKIEQKVRQILQEESIPEKTKLVEQYLSKVNNKVKDNEKRVSIHDQHEFVEENKNTIEDSKTDSECKNEIVREDSENTIDLCDVNQKTDIPSVNKQDTVKNKTDSKTEECNNSKENDNAMEKIFADISNAVRSIDISHQTNSSGDDSCESKSDSDDDIDKETDSKSIKRLDYKAIEERMENLKRKLFLKTQESGSDFVDTNRTCEEMSPLDTTSEPSSQVVNYQEKEPSEICSEDDDADSNSAHGNDDRNNSPSKASPNDSDGNYGDFNISTFREASESTNEYGGNGKILKYSEEDDCGKGEETESNNCHEISAHMAQCQYLEFKCKKDSKNTEEESGPSSLNESPFDRMLREMKNKKSVQIKKKKP